MAEICRRKGEGGLRTICRGVYSYDKRLGEGEDCS